MYLKVKTSKFDFILFTILIITTLIILFIQNWCSTEQTEIYAFATGLEGKGEACYLSKEVYYIDLYLDYFAKFIAIILSISVIKKGIIQFINLFKIDKEG